MVYTPDTVEQVYNSLENSLTNKISSLTNFTERSFNFVFTRAISSYIRELELKLLASELSAYIEYAGGPVTDEDLRKLGVDDSVDPDELNRYMNDEQLDELVSVVGVTRDQGTPASGFVDISVDDGSSVTIPEGTIVTTLPDSDGEILEYETLDERSSTIGQQTIVDIPVEAVSVGESYNIPANEIVRIQDPPIGARGVADSTSIDGGRGVESNDDLRERAKRAISEEPTGGTVRGIRGYITNNISSVENDDISISELFSEDPVVVEVTVDGGSTNEIEDAIDESRPVGVKHELIRPKTIEIDVDASLLGQDIDFKFVTEAVEDYLIEDLTVSDDFYQDNLIRQIMQSDSNIINVGNISVSIASVTNERHEYDTAQAKYKLDSTYDGDSITVYTKTDTGTNVFEESTDYKVVDKGGDGLFERIEWLSVDEPSDGQDFFVDYTVNRDANYVSDEEHTFIDPKNDTIVFENQVSEYKLSEIPNEATISITDEDNNSYSKGSDYELINSSVGTHTETFLYSSGRDIYHTNRSFFESSITVSAGTKTYTKGSDYTVTDSNSDGLQDTIEWLDNGESPSNDQQFTVEYEINNGLEQTVNWLSNGSSPSVGDDFTVSYQKQVYELNDEISIISPDKVSCNCPDSTYALNTDYNFVDVNADGEKDAIEWIDSGSNPSDDTIFYVTYRTEGDLELTKQEKIDPSTVTVTEQ